LILRDPELAQDGEVADRDLLDRALARLEPEARADLL
jgi:hypothetical protein